MDAKETQKAKVAVFDFDGTSIEGSSPTRLVNRLILERRLTPLTGFKIGLWGLAYKWHLPQNEAWVRGLVFSAFDGMPKEEADAYMRRFYDEHIQKRFRPEADKAMRQRAAEGCEVVVVSASFEPIVMRAMEQHPFDAQISTRMRLREDGTYTCEVEGRPMEGEEKLIALSHWCDGRFGEGNWELAYAYGDHHSDIPLLQAARHPFAVTPNSSLKKHAREQGWEILDWEMDGPEES